MLAFKELLGTHSLKNRGDNVTFRNVQPLKMKVFLWTAGLLAVFRLFIRH